MVKNITGKKLVKLLAKKIECEIKPHTRGSHVGVQRYVNGKRCVATIPIHNNYELAPFILKRIRESLGLTKDEWKIIFSK